MDEQLYSQLSPYFARMGITRADWQLVEDIAKHATEQVCETINTAVNVIDDPQLRFLAHFLTYKYVSDATNSAMLALMQHMR